MITVLSIVIAFLTSQTTAGLVGNCESVFRSALFCSKNSNDALQRFEELYQLPELNLIIDGRELDNLQHSAISCILSIFQCVRCVSVSQSNKVDAQRNVARDFAKFAKRLATVLQDLASSSCDRTTLWKPICNADALPYTVTNMVDSLKTHVRSSSDAALAGAMKALNYTSAFFSDKGYRIAAKLRNAINATCSNSSHAHGLGHLLWNNRTDLFAKLQTYSNWSFWCSAAIGEARTCVSPRQLLVCENLVALSTVLANAGCVMVSGTKRTLDDHGAGRNGSAYGPDVVTMPVSEEYAMLMCGSDYLDRQRQCGIRGQSFGETQLRKWTNASLASHYSNLVTIEFRSVEGLGNVMFKYASLLGVAETYGMLPVIPHQTLDRLSEVFEMRANVHSSHSEISWRPLTEKRCCVYSPEIFRPIAANKDANYVLGDLLQSFKYFAKKPLPELLTEQEFCFKRDVLEAATTKRQAILKKHCVSANEGKCVLIGIHNRRGDFLLPHWQEVGMVVADVPYLTAAMLYYMKHFQAGTHLVFSIVSNDYKWNLENMNVTLKHDGMDISYSIEIVPTSTTGVDLVFLTHCDHLIIAGGTYGWWAAYLGRGRVIRMSQYPRPGSPLAADTNVADHFPAHWMQM